MPNQYDDIAKATDAGKERYNSFARYQAYLNKDPKKLLLYIDGSKVIGKRLQRLIEKRVAKDRLEIYRTIEELTCSLRRPRYSETIAVLVPNDMQALLALLFMGDLFLNVRIILILPDRRPETVARGLKLYPRFYSYADSDFKNVAAVLSKMLSVYNYNI